MRGFFLSKNKETKYLITLSEYLHAKKFLLILLVKIPPPKSKKKLHSLQLALTDITKYQTQSELLMLRWMQEYTAVWYILNKHICIQSADIYLCYNCTNSADEDKKKRIETNLTLGIEVKVMTLMGSRFLLSVRFSIPCIHI